MKTTYNIKNYQLQIQKGFASLLLNIKLFHEKQTELERIVRVAILLIKTGVSQNNSIFQKILNSCLNEQKVDGGWTDVEETIWVLSFISNFSENKEIYEKGIHWLKSQKHKDGSWGNTERDIGRIPITGLLIYLLPELSSMETMSWLQNEWDEDKEKFPVLTYKGSFILMALKNSMIKSKNRDLNMEISQWLQEQQEEDGGWAPCKNHPIGSTPLYTGISLIGLLQYPKLLSNEVIEKGVNWLVENQLPDGMWPDHYIEEGSAWAFYSLVEGYKYLTKC